MKTIKAKILYIAALFALVFTCLCPHTDKGNSHVYAAENKTSLDTTDVMDDLADADLSELTQELTEDKLYVISFTEYAFAYDANGNGNFGLYIYVYNPSAKTIVMNTTQNQINFGVQYEDGVATAWDKFGMRCLSVSEDGKYAKFKIVDAVSKITNETILSRLLASKLQRIYDIAEIEVCHAYGELAESYAVGKRYVCTGFAEGYGQNAGTPSTLETYCDTSETISLDVHATQYRLDGNNGKNVYTQDSLHSVYFTVPNEYAEKYGDMTAVHAHWLNAVLKPILVTGNQDAYEAILPFLGVNIGKGVSKEVLQYRYTAGAELVYNSDLNRYEAWVDWGYNVAHATDDFQGLFDYKEIYSEENLKGNLIETLYIMFNAGEGTDSADDFIPPSEGEGSLAAKMVEMTAKYGGELVEERYSRILFESVDEEYTDKKIESSEVFKIRNVGIDKAHWWEFWQGKDKVDKSTLDRFVGVKAIEPVTQSVMDKSPEEACETLKIGLHDYKTFRAYYEDNKDNGTVYLFRYKLSDYYAREAGLSKNSINGETKFDEKLGIPTSVDTNAYFFQEECDIGFDIIDITLTNEQGEHILGVAAKPIDVFPTPTPPLITTTDKTPWDELLFWLKMIVGIILVVLLIVAVCVFVPPIGTALVYVVVLPFKGLAWLGKKLGALFKRWSK